MNKLLEQAITAASSLSDEGQTKLAQHMMEEAKRLAILEAIAEADANPDGGIPHEEMVKWLESWGTENELPQPKCR